MSWPNLYLISLLIQMFRKIKILAHFFLECQDEFGKTPEQKEAHIDIDPSNQQRMLTCLNR